MLTVVSVLSIGPVTSFVNCEANQEHHVADRPILTAILHPGKHVAWAAPQGFCRVGLATVAYWSESSGKEQLMFVCVIWHALLGAGREYFVTHF